MSLCMQICEAQQGQRMDTENPGKLIDLLQGGASQSSLDHTDICATGDFGKILLGHTLHQPEFFKALREGLLGVHWVIPFGGDDQLNVLNTIALQTIVFIFSHSRK